MSDSRVAERSTTYLPDVWLLDVNVLLAMVWPSHAHHAVAHRWFFAIEDRPWATCAVTEMALVRLSSNPRFTSEAVAPAEALAMLRSVRAMTGHRYLADDTSLADAPLFQRPGLVGHRQVTDMYLLALAARHGARLATLDRALVGYAKAHNAPADWIGATA